MFSAATNRGRGPSAIYAIRADGSGLRRLTPPGATYNDTEPAWSPNGSKIAYISNRDEAQSGWRDLYVMNADGSHQRRLTHMAAQVSSPAWSPNGKSIIFSSGDDLYELDPKSPPTPRTDGGFGFKGLVNLGVGSIPAISTDGNVAYTQAYSEVDAYLANLRALEAGRLNEKLSGPGSGYREFRWSPDGSTLAFVSTSGNIQTLAHDGTSKDLGFRSDGGISWSPAGDTIAFTESGAPGETSIKLWSRKTRATRRFLSFHGFGQIDYIDWIGTSPRQGHPSGKPHYRIPTTSVSTATNDWKTTEGYTATSTVSVYAPAHASDPPSLPTSGRQSIAACDVDREADAVVPVSYEITNTTASFSIRIGLIIDDPALAGNGYYGDIQYTDGSSTCLPNIDDTNLFSVISHNELSPGSSLSGDFYVVIRNYFTPNHPRGNHHLLQELCLAPIADFESGSGHIGTLTAGGPACVRTPRRLR